MKIQILGRGCPECQKLEENTEKALEDLSGDIEIEKVYDLQEASKMGMMSAPGLAIDGELKKQGSVLKPGEIREVIEDER
ncbi:MAG: thioredoxin family protein [Candidatus Nanohaloarchaea archaeon]|nr:thioredoxin family protein [Candidatus Nanohaloarchaea archaeon]